MTIQGGKSLDESEKIDEKTGICLLSLVMILPFFYLQNPTVGV
ncbi:hypothetical protein SD457_00495 [Coprobacillaceae bacterium CR2/5/TPMF4]|nr:hypothetical protein SD457_00495 [Coprobacillaceae bacterium CR2/5/TPMF4]